MLSAFGDVFGILELGFWLTLSAIALVVTRAGIVLFLLIAATSVLIHRGLIRFDSVYFHCGLTIATLPETRAPPRF